MHKFFLFSFFLLWPFFNVWGQTSSLRQISSRAQISEFTDHYTLKATASSSTPWTLGAEYPIVDRTNPKEILAFVHLFSKRKWGESYELTFKMTKHLRRRFVLNGDEILGIDLGAPPLDFYLGNTELFVKDRAEVPARIKPLVYQGLVIGETAETLAQHENLASIFGIYHYGFTNDLSLHALISGLFYNTYSVGGKFKFYTLESQIFSLGFDALQLNVTNDNSTEKQSSVKASLYWDSISSSNLVSHTRLSVSVLNINSNENNRLINYFTSSSIQTGYEFVRMNWHRILVGPSYNFLNKTVGGYLAYMMMWDHLHVALELDSNDINSFRFTKDFTTERGYYPSFDIFWRF